MMVAAAPTMLYAVFSKSGGRAGSTALDVFAIILGLAGTGFAVWFLWWEVHIMGTLRHQAMRVSAQAFEYWDWRARHFAIPWDQVASIEALDRKGVVRVYYAPDGEPAKVDLSDTIAWHKGLQTQILRLFRERAQLTHEEPVLRGKMMVGQRYTREGGADQAS
jgi:hypothetical protein